jgi:BlaI family transcriptional regulator, penicillinase repressor
MNKNKAENLSPANFEIMKIVWEKGEVTINDVVDAINAKREDELRRTTIQVQMNRLEEYGWLKHRKEGRTFYYTAVKEKQKTRRDIVMDIKERVFSGSHTELVKCLVDGSDLKPNDIKELRQLLDQYDKDNS